MMASQDADPVFVIQNLPCPKPTTLKERVEKVKAHLHPVQLIASQPGGYSPIPLSAFSCRLDADQQRLWSAYSKLEAAKTRRVKSWSSKMRRTLLPRVTARVTSQDSPGKSSAPANKAAIDIQKAEADLASTRRDLHSHMAENNRKEDAWKAIEPVLDWIFDDLSEKSSKEIEMTETVEQYTQEVAQASADLADRQRAQACIETAYYPLLLARTRLEKLLVAAHSSRQQEAGALPPDACENALPLEERDMIGIIDACRVADEQTAQCSCEVEDIISDSLSFQLWTTTRGRCFERMKADAEFRKDMHSACERLKLSAHALLLRLEVAKEETERARKALTSSNELLRHSKFVRTRRRSTQICEIVNQGF